MSGPDPDPGFRPVHGHPEPLGDGLFRIVAPNPSPMTFRGTNTYVIGRRDLFVIDPGPDDPCHLQAILSALPERSRVRHILVTHAHLDHSHLARTLSRETGAPVLAFGGPQAGRSAVMERLAEGGLVQGGEGVDHGFAPDARLGDGDEIASGDYRIRALHTPGHFGNHLSFDWDGTLFTGDLVMGWASSMVSPPDGDLTDFMASLTRLNRHRWSRLLPGHGAPVEDASARLSGLLAHRRAREAQILAALAAGPATLKALTARIYTDTDPRLLPAAARNVLAHLIDLMGQSRVTHAGDLSPEAVFSLS
ncbi:MBL fold metallo-hydrolase [Litorisediminicola beolgyonensis]|uniref:MBL fold metallo-hydrolase n=1 Tax=Litorisediminicola beolgyonensis TaxID=1173614 RepID=A0ABW3ZME8_9RHOB